MPTINTLYIPLFTIEEVILDKDSGNPLAGGVVKFFRDSQRAQPKPVYQISGTSPNYTFNNVGNEFELGLNGTFVDVNDDPFVPYAYPYDADGEIDYYYVTVESAGGVSQFTREAVPYIASSSAPGDNINGDINELSNAQFVDVNFDKQNSIVINVTGSNTVTNIAPNWDMVTTGTGTLTVEWITPTSLSSPTNPPYAFEVLASSTLGATVTLRQRIEHSPRLFASNYVSAILAVAVIGGGDTTITVDYVPSTGTTTTLIDSASIPTDGEFHEITGNSAITAENTDPASTGYVDFNITLPTQRTLRFTSAQLAGSDEAQDIPFEEASTPRQIDHLFHYYQSQINFKPIPSMLVGWDFPLNPAQISGVSVGSITNSPKYVWDQLIMDTTRDGASVTRDSVSGGLEVTTAAGGGCGVQLFQYLPSRTVKQLIGGRLAINVNAWNKTAAATVTCRAYLFRGTSAASIPTPLPGQFLTTLATTGAAAIKPTINNWAKITQGNFGATATEIKTITTSDEINEGTDYQFKNFEIRSAADINDTEYAAIAVTFGTDTASTVFTVQSISLVEGDIATRPAPKTLADTVKECNFFYETTYDVGTAPGTATTNGSLVAPMDTLQTGGVTYLANSPFFIDYAIKRLATPTITFYNTNGTISSVFGQLFYNGGSVATVNFASTNWALGHTGEKGSSYIPSGTGVITSHGAAGNTSSGLIRVHYTIDARLGEV